MLDHRRKTISMIYFSKCCKTYPVFNYRVFGMQSSRTKGIRKWKIIHLYLKRSWLILIRPYIFILINFLIVKVLIQVRVFSVSLHTFFFFFFFPNFWRSDLVSTIHASSTIFLHPNYNCNLNLTKPSHFNPAHGLYWFTFFKGKKTYKLSWLSKMMTSEHLWMVLVSTERRNICRCEIQF